MGVWLGEGIGLGGVVGMAALVVAQARTSRGRVSRMIILWVFTYAKILSGMRGSLTAYSLPGLWTPFARGESCFVSGLQYLHVGEGLFVGDVVLGQGLVQFERLGLIFYGLTSFRVDCCRVNHWPRSSRGYSVAVVGW